MLNLVEEAEAEYEQIGSGRLKAHVTKLYTGYFDFLTSTETKTKPLHIIEARREEQRRNRVADGEPALYEFMRSLDIDEADIKECMETLGPFHPEASVRAYYGDQDDKVFGLFRNRMTRYIEDAEWLKRQTFLGKQTAKEYERQRYVDGNAPGVSDGGMLMPATSQKESFLAKARKKPTV
ncbi:hypothetical protein JKF63_02540 [Porcisia hertigi]|uniref:Uncharacterized protein n=1 Tax=Porcisia hertigi TaxID=2761500 RepID=A0A836HRE3_9TRYP|nr:hypothetical protein JKF63_02540 [Porcisia hertigi]